MNLYGMVTDTCEELIIAYIAPKRWLSDNGYVDDYESAIPCWFDKVMEIDVKCTIFGEYKGSSLMVRRYPNIYVDTKLGLIIGEDGEGGHEEVRLPRDVNKALDNYVRELWERNK